MKRNGEEPSITIPNRFDACLLALRHWAKRNNLPIDNLKITIEVRDAHERYQWEAALLLEWDHQLVSYPVQAPPPFSSEDFLPLYGVKIRLVTTQYTRSHVSLQKLDKPR